MGRARGEEVPLELGGVPGPVQRLVEALEEAGHEAFLVGGCVRDLLRGAAPLDFDLATSAAPDAVLALFPRAVATGIRHGTVMIPTAAGPVDVTSYRAGPSLTDDLAHRDFTLNAIAYHPLRRTLIDPFGGRSDLAKGLLRAVGRAADRFAEDPLRALRAARLRATLGVEVDSEVEADMGAASKALEGVARERVRHELATLLLGEDAPAALALLRRTGLEAGFAPRVPDDAAAVVGALPPDLELRLAGWLRGTRAVSILRRLRFPRATTQRVERLLREHPVDLVTPPRDASVRRLLRRAGESSVPLLLALRRAELDVGAPAGTPEAAAARERLEVLEQVLERVQRAGRLALRRQDLAVDGATVMEWLGLRPGPAVGRVLRHLTDRVIEDPANNDPERLRELALAWAGAERGERS